MPSSSFSSSYLLGLFFIFLVTILWSGASIIVQYLYTELDFHSPFLLTYVSTSLFTILLPTRVLWEQLLLCKDYYFRNNTDVDGTLDKVIDELFRNNTDVDGTLDKVIDELAENNQPRNVVIPFRSGPPPCSLGNDDDGEEIDPCLSNHDHGEENEPLEIDGNYCTITNDSNAKIEEKPFILGHYETFFLSLRIAPLWFLADYTYNVSLAYTTITSSTILANTGTLFTFIFALSCGEEKFTWYKLFGVMLCMLGSVLTGLEDIKNNNDSSTNSTDDFTTDDNNTSKTMGAFGDLMGLLSAIGYGGCK